MKNDAKDIAKQYHVVNPTKLQRETRRIVEPDWCPSFAKNRSGNSKDTEPVRTYPWNLRSHDARLMCFSSLFFGPPFNFVRLYDKLNKLTGLCVQIWCVSINLPNNSRRVAKNSSEYIRRRRIYLYFLISRRCNVVQMTHLVADCNVTLISKIFLWSCRCCISRSLLTV